MAVPVTEEDQRDIADSLKGDEQAFARLVTRYEALVFAQMWRFTRDRHILDELVQDVFVEVFLSLSKFRGQAPFLHWLRKIATRTGYRYWKLEKRDKRRREALAEQPLPWPAPSPDVPSSEASEWLYRLLGCLEPKDRFVLTLYYFDECGAAEIAERMGWSPVLVRVRMHRAIKKLRRLIEAAGDGRQDYV